MLPAHARVSSFRLADRRKQSQKLNPRPGSSVGRMLKNFYREDIQRLVAAYKDYNGRPPPGPADRRLDRVKNVYLPYLEFDFYEKMRPEEVRYGKVKEALADLKDAGNKLPQSVALKAAQLYEEFNNAGWAAPVAKSPTTRAPQHISNTYPASNHPIYGDHGIMHGVIMRRNEGGRPSYCLDDRLTRRNAKVYGHNNFQPGFWVPRQECLIFHGQHAQPQRGISGDPDHGAYSIVVSGEYDDIDRDEGDTIYYGGEGAHGRDSPRKLNSTANKSMQASYLRGQPIRVYRNAKGSKPFAPPCGIRYDGLYRIVDCKRRVNKDGGLYDQYKLVREPNQPSLEEIMHSSPTSQQREDHGKVSLGYD